MKERIVASVFRALLPCRVPNALQFDRNADELMATNSSRQAGRPAGSRVLAPISDKLENRRRPAIISLSLSLSLSPSLSLPLSLSPSLVCQINLIFFPSRTIALVRSRRLVAATRLGQNRDRRATLDAREVGHGSYSLARGLRAFLSIFCLGNVMFSYYPQ
jgi:hypothetical protein